MAEAGRFWVQLAPLSRPETPRPELSPLICRPAPVGMKRVSFPVAAADKEDVDNVAAGFAVNVNLVKSILLIPRERFLETPPSSAAAVPREECCRH